MDAALRPGAGGHRRRPARGAVHRRAYFLEGSGVHYAGAVTSYGSTLFKDFVVDHDSEITAPLKRWSRHLPQNQRRLEHGARELDGAEPLRPDAQSVEPGAQRGGSSGGSAAAVASGMAPMANSATDGGRSSQPRWRAAFGLKPTRARNPMGPDAGEGWGALGGARRHPHGAGQRRATRRDVGTRRRRSVLGAAAGGCLFLQEVGRDPGHLRIALATPPWNGQPVDPDAPRRRGRRRASASGSATTWRKRAPISTRAPSARRPWS